MCFMRPTGHPRRSAYGLGLLICVLSGLVSRPAAAAPLPHRPLPPVSHPLDDHAGSTIAAHERADAAGGAAPTVGTRKVRGMDVSHWQGSIDWPAVRAQGGRFVYIKATEGKSFTDPKFSSNSSGSAASGLFHGAYHFALPDRSTGKTQADYLIDHGGGWSADGRTLPPMLDIEYNPYDRNAACYGLSPREMVTWVTAFSNEVRARTSRYPTIYTTTNWWTICTDNSPRFGPTNPLFIARWSTTVGLLPAGWATYTLWQHANAGPFPGDQDWFHGTVSGLRRFALPAA